jgi:hypothetical protein
MSALRFADFVKVDAGGYTSAAQTRSAPARCPAGGWRTCVEKRGEWDVATDAANQALSDPVLLR